MGEGTGSRLGIQSIRLSPLRRAAAEPGENAAARWSFSGHFREWLQDHGYGDRAFASAIRSGFGGRSGVRRAPARRPVLFIHGNGDKAASWAASRRYFERKGYGPGDLYGMTWGNANPLLAPLRHHSARDLREVRAFIEAVLAYTGAKEVDIITHSMGVTLARKAIIGGKGRALDGEYDLGPSLKGRVRTFVGIAGGNRGLKASALSPLLPTNNVVDGFYPEQPLLNVAASAFLHDLNTSGERPGKRVISFWSKADKIAKGARGAAPTSRIPGQDGERVYQGYDHFDVRDRTVADQFRVVAT